MRIGKMYDHFHNNSKLMKRVISKDDFTYINILEVVNKHIKNGSDILDVGCGVGTLSFYLAKNKNCQVLGVDVSSNAVKAAKRNSQHLGLQTETHFRKQSFPKLHLNKRFDYITMIEVLEHLDDDLKALNTTSRYLKRGGRLLISVPSKSAPLYKLGCLKSFDRRVGHLRRYSDDEFTRLINEAGNEIIAKYSCEGILRNTLFTTKIFGWIIRFIRGPISKILNSIDKHIFRLFGYSQLIYVIKK